MLLDTQFTVPFPRALVWTAFKDVERLVTCMPGASLRSPPVAKDDGLALDLGFAVKLGPIAANFSGQGAVAYVDADYGGTLSGAGADRATNSRVKGTAKFALAEIDDGAGTQVKVDIDYALTGALAQFSRGGIVKEIANALTEQFAQNLKARLSEAGAQAAAGPSAAPSFASRKEAGGTPTGAPAASSGHLSAGRLILRALWAWLRGLLGLR